MTNEEAIKWLEYSKQGETGKAVEAADMAIKALEAEPTEDTISRQALKDVLIHDWAFHFPQTEYNERKGYRKRDREVSTVIENMPSIIPSRPTGHWIEEKGERFIRRVCSVCGDWHMMSETPYCPFCGAKMEGQP